MKLKGFPWLFAALLLIAPLYATAQISSDCPKLELIGSQRSIAAKSVATFVLDLSEDRPEEFGYEWIVENGEVANGQGTRVAEVSSTHYGSTAKVTATVHGLPKTCPNSTFTTISVDSKPEWHMLDEWGDMIENDQRSRLISFFYELASNEGQMGLIIIGTPKANQPAVVKRRLKLILDQAAFIKFDKTRLVYCTESGSPSAFRVYRFRPKFQEMFPYPDCTPIPVASVRLK